MTAETTNTADSVEFQFSDYDKEDCSTYCTAYIVYSGLAGLAEQREVENFSWANSAVSRLRVFTGHRSRVKVSVEVFHAFHSAGLSILFFLTLISAKGLIVWSYRVDRRFW